MKRENWYWLLIIMLVASIAWLLFATHPADGAVPRAKLAPPVPCTSKNRMDFFVDEDGIMYECQCQVLKSMPLCAWQVIGGVESVAARKLRRSHPRARLIPVLTVRMP